LRRIAAIALVLVLLAACDGSSPTPPTTSAPTSVSTSAPTTSSTSAATTVPTTRFTSPVLTGPDSAACSSLHRLEIAMRATVPDYDRVAQAARAVVGVARHLDDQGQATLLATIGTDAANAAKAFLDGDFAKGARLQNRVLDTIPPAKVALDCV
jgi:hypothetical protein